MIHARAVTKSYGKRLVLRSVEARAVPGEAVALLGENGAGKTTLLRVLAGLVQPDEGEVCIDGRRVAERRGDVSYLPEGAPLYRELRVEESLLFRARLGGKRDVDARVDVEAVVRAAGLDGVRRCLVGELSLGWRRRVALASTLVGPPRVVLLDEPMAALDHVQTARMKELLIECAKTSVLIVATHHRTDVDGVAKRTWVLREGRLTDGSPR